MVLTSLDLTDLHHPEIRCSDAQNQIEGEGDQQPDYSLQMNRRATENKAC